MSLIDEWYLPHPTLKSRALTPVSWLYDGVRRIARGTPLRTHSLGATVVVIGNLTVGGTGKTPLTLFLAQHLRARGWRVGVVSRGYPASPNSPIEVTPSSYSKVVGDEPLLYARSGLPIVVCAHRLAAAQALLRAHPGLNLILADDALQHTALPRDIEICVVDGARGFGNGHLLPAGPLREPIARLQSCDALVVNGDNARAIAHDRKFSMHVESATLATLAGEIIEPSRENAERVSIIAGIGNPEKFFANVCEKFPALRGAHTHAFADHHGFSAAEINALRGDTVLMTEKDAVRCATIAADIKKRVLVARAQSRVEPDLVDWLEATLKEKGYGRKNA